MLQGLCDVSPSAVPFVRQFYGTPSRYLWEDDSGEVHDIDQGEGGEQGDPLMPMLFSLGQHNALRAVQVRLQEGELIFPYLDDVYIVCSPERVSAICAILQEELWRHAGIRIHHGEMQVWNRSGNRPVVCDVVWRGGGEPAHQGIMILGTPLGHEDVRAQLEHIVDEHNVLLERIPSLPDVQSAWALLLHWHNARANYALPVIRPELTRHFAQAHDAGLWRCLCAILRVGEDITSPQYGRSGCAAPCARAAVHFGRVGQIHCLWSGNATLGWRT